MGTPLILKNAICLEVPDARSTAAFGQAANPPAAGSEQNTLRRATPYTFQSTAADSLTVTALAALTGVSVRDYVGNLLECTSGAAQGQKRMITAYSGAGVLTVAPAFSPAPTGTESWRMSILPDPVVIGTAAWVGATLVVASAADASGRPGRQEDADYWNEASAALTAGDRYTLIGITGVNTNRVALIIDWAPSTFTVESGVMSGGADGDLYLIRKIHRQYNAEFTMPDLGQGYIDRDFVHNDWDGQTGILGPRSGGKLDKFTLEVSRLAIAASGATVAEPPAAEHDLLRSVLGYSTDSTSTTAAGSTSSIIRITVGQRARFTVGDAVLINDEMAWIVDSGAGDGVTYNSITVSPALTQAPPSGVTVYGAANYNSERRTGLRTHSLDLYLGGGPGRIRINGWGAAPMLEGMDTEGQVPRWVLGGPCDSFWEDPAALPSWNSAYGTRFPSATAMLPHVARAAIGLLAPAPGSLTPAARTAITLRGFSLNPGIMIAMRKAITGIEGNDGAYLAGLAKGGATGTLHFDLEDLSQLERFRRGAVLELAMQFGNAQPAGCFGVWVRRMQFTKFDVKHSGTTFTADASFRVLASDTNGNATGGSGTTRVPQWVVSYV